MRSLSFKKLLNKLGSEDLSLIIALLFLLFNCVSCREDYKASSDAVSLQKDSVKFYLDQIDNENITKEEKTKKVAKALEFARNYNPDTLKRVAFAEIAKVYSDLKEFDSYKRISLEMGANARDMEDSIGIAASFYNLGSYYYNVDKMDSAYNNYFYAEKLYANLDKKDDAGKAMLSMAIIQKNLKDYVGSEASSIKAIKYFLITENIRYLASANSNLGLVSTEQNQFDLAIDYHEKALDYRKQLKNKALEASSYNNIGLIYLKKEQYSEAIKNYDKGLNYDSLIHIRPTTYARLLDNRAYAEFLAGDTDELPQLFREILEFRDSLNDNSGMVTSSLHLAEYYIAKDSFSTAKIYAKNALEKSKQLKHNQDMLESLRLLSKTSDDKEALEYSKTFIKITDSLQKQERAFQDQFARIRFETDKLETERNIVAKQKENLIIAIMFLALTFLFVYTIIQRKLSRNEFRFRASQQEANEEIYSLMLDQQLKLEEGKQLEKRRISEELHDGVLGRLFGTRLSLDGLNRKNDDATMLSRSKYIDELKSIEQEIRRISHDLNSNLFSPEDVYVDVVETLINKICEQNGLNYEFHNDEVVNWEAIADSKKVHFYRIIQESMQNILKHAKANLVRVSFVLESNFLQLKVEDDGIGMNVNKIKSGIGIKNIKSRVNQMGGKLKVNSSPTNGTSILVEINY